MTTTSRAVCVNRISMEQSKLADMNDEGKSFMDIAAYIRANL